MPQYEMKCRCRIVRFEERAREFVHMAMANLIMSSRRETNRFVCRKTVKRRIKSACSHVVKTRSLAIYAWAG